MDVIYSSMDSFVQLFGQSIEGSLVSDEATAWCVQVALKWMSLDSGALTPRHIGYRRLLS